MVEPVAERKFLVLHDYGMGGSRAYPWTEPEGRIQREYPESKVIHDAPPRMTGETRARIERTSPFDIDAPMGWLAISEEECP